MDDLDIDLDERDLARLLSLGRMAFGTFAFLAPRRFGKLWTGEEPTDVTSKVAMRSLGARDVALALGTLLALEGDGRPSRWLEAQAIADASDVFSTLSSWGRLRTWRRWGTLVTAGTACWLGVTLAQALADE